MCAIKQVSRSAAATTDKLSAELNIRPDLNKNVNKVKLFFQDAATIIFDYGISREFSKADKKTIKDIVRGKLNDQLADETVHTTFLTVVKGGNKKMTKRLIQKGIDVNQKNRELTALQLAVLKKNYTLALKLIKYGADVDQLTPDQRVTLLAHGLRHSNFRNTSKLASASVIDLPLDKEGNTLLHYAVKQGDTEVMQYLLKKGANINQQNLHGISPLSAGITTGNMKIVKLLLSAKNKDANVADEQGNTPLHNLFFSSLASHKRRQIAQLLIDNGADVNATDKAGFTPLHYATSQGSPDIKMLDLLISRGARLDIGPSPLSIQLVTEHPEIAEQLIMAGADINNCKDNQGNTLLHQALLRDKSEDRAVQSKEVAVVNFLLEKGAYINTKNLLGKTPLAIAVQKGKTQEATLLLEKGAQLESELMHHAVQQDRIAGIPMVRLLKKHGAKVNAKDSEGKTPLHHALEQNKGAMFDLLLEEDKVVFPNAKSIKVLPGHIDTALRLGNKLAAEKLIKLNKSALNELDGDGQTPLHQAIRRSGFEDISFLLNHGANANQPNRNNTTPLEYAFNQEPFSEGVILALLRSGAEIKENMLSHLFKVAFEQELIELAQELLRRGADINTLRGGAKTLLHEAVEMKKRPVIEALLTLGADANIADNEGNTPLKIAIQMQEKELIGLLILKSNLKTRAAAFQFASTLHHKDDKFMQWLTAQYKVLQSK